MEGLKAYHGGATSGLGKIQVHEAKEKNGRDFQKCKV